MQTYKVTLTGVTPLIMHADNIEAADAMERWQKDPQNKKSSKAGDDRTPAWRWMACLYIEGGRVVIPADNLMTMLREGGAKVPTGKGQTTFKAASQSGLVVNEAGWDVVTPKGVVTEDSLAALRTEGDFDVHQGAAARLGFFLFVKRARIGQSKHVRVRPRFDSWRAAGTITVLDDRITKDVLTSILDQGGAYCGLGDWRPSSPKSGWFGRFTAEVRKA